MIAEGESCLFLPDDKKQIPKKEIAKNCHTVFPVTKMGDSPHFMPGYFIVNYYRKDQRRI